MKAVVESTRWSYSQDDNSVMQLSSLDQKTTNNQTLENGTTLFNAAPEDGIKFLNESGAIVPKYSPTATAKLLLCAPGINRKVLGEYLSRTESLWNIYIGLYDFTDRPLDMALRSLLETVVLPSSKSDQKSRRRAILAFSTQYFNQNEHCGVYCNVSVVFAVASTLVKLNESSSSSLESFLQWCNDAMFPHIDDNSAPVSPALLESMYKRVKKHKFDLANHSEDSFLLELIPDPKPFQLKEKDLEGWVWLREYPKSEAGPSKWIKLWLILADWVIYAFPATPERAGGPICIIPLQDTNVSLNETCDAIVLVSELGFKCFYPELSESSIQYLESLKGENSPNSNSQSKTNSSPSMNGKKRRHGKVENILENKPNQIEIKCDTIASLDGWFETLKRQKSHPSSKAMADFHNKVESKKDKSGNRARSSKKNLSSNETVELRKDSVHGYLGLKIGKFMSVYNKRYCVTIGRRLYYAASREDALEKKKFRGFVDLFILNSVKASGSVGNKDKNGKYVMLLKCSKGNRLCSISVPTASEFSKWLQVFTGICELNQGQGGKESHVTYDQSVNSGAAIEKQNTSPKEIVKQNNTENQNYEYSTSPTSSQAGDSFTSPANDNIGTLSDYNNEPESLSTRQYQRNRKTEHTSSSPVTTSPVYNDDQGAYQATAAHYPTSQQPQFQVSSRSQLKTQAAGSQPDYKEKRYGGVDDSHTSSRPYQEITTSSSGASRLMSSPTRSRDYRQSNHLNVNTDVGKSYQGSYPSSTGHVSTSPSSPGSWQKTEKNSFSSPSRATRRMMSPDTKPPIPPAIPPPTPPGNSS